MSLRCLVGVHDLELVYAVRATPTTPAVPARWRCVRCGHEKKVGFGHGGEQPNPKYSGHLTASEVKRITKRTGRPPVYVSEHARKELAAAAAATKTAAERRKKRRPAIVEQIRRSA